MPSPDRFRFRGGAAGFTLVELLAVIGIIVILITLTAVGMRGIDGTASRRSAVGTLMGVFDQARIVAISDGRATYVVFASAPRGQQMQNASTVPSTMWGRAYAVFEDPALQDSSTAASFVPVQRSAWMYLPTGVAFKSDAGGSSSATFLSVTEFPRAAADTVSFKVGANSGSGLMLPYVKFDATGQIVDYTGNTLDTTSEPQRVLLFEGTASSAGVEVLTRTRAINATDGKKYALDEIMLKPTTGRARYTLDPSSNVATSN